MSCGFAALPGEVVEVDGRAEAAVKYLKGQAKLLLNQTKLPRSCWPLAMVYAAHRQRLQATGEDKPLPFGSPVHVRAKVYGTGGKFDLDDRWRNGVYVGPSSDMKDGYVVRFPDGSYVTSAHLRPYLVDPDQEVELDPVEMDLPVPRRRVREKMKLSSLTWKLQRPLSEIELEAEQVACRLYKERNWSAEAVQELFEVLKKTKPSGTRMSMAPDATAWYCGAYVHGGVAGVRTSTKRMTWASRYLAKAAKVITGVSSFGAIGLMENMALGVHRDMQNQPDTKNTVVLLKEPKEGGALWIEDEEQTEVEPVWRQVSRKNWKKGVVHELEKGKPLTFSPRRWHEVQPWEGSRLVMALYTPRVNTMHQVDREALEGLGFKFPNAIQIQNDSIAENAIQIQNDSIAKNAVQIQNDSIAKNAVQIQNDSIAKNAVQIQRPDPE